MQAAVSTACLYPKPTEDALYELCLLGIQHVEIFLNSPSECRQVFVNDLAAMLKRFGTKCLSVHPWTAPNEGYMLFSGYPRRASDFLEEAKQIFQAMQRLGAKYYVLHGAPAGACKTEIFCERFKLLSDAGRQFGVTVTLENVHRFESQSLRFLREFCRLLGDDAKLTFDTKQAVRAGIEIDEAVRVLGEHIVHVHVSDHGARGDCLRIGQGSFRIADFLRALGQKGFDGSVVLELYREGFGAASELAEDCRKLAKIINGLDKGR